jgi:hypothetical protein
VVDVKEIFFVRKIFHRSLPLHNLKNNFLFTMAAKKKAKAKKPAKKATKKKK